MKHQWKFIWGNLKKSKVTSGFNIVGLTIAFAAFILIMLYVWNEYHFDGFQQNKADIYRLEMKGPEDAKSMVFMVGPTGKILKEQLPEVLNSAIYMPWGKWGEIPFYYDTPSGEQSLFLDYSYCDESLTDIFTFNFLNGNNTNPLTNPESAIISRSLATRLWGNTDPVGKQLRFQTYSYTITGVFADLPENSVFRCPVILRIPPGSDIEFNSKNWVNWNYPTYLLVKHGTNPNTLAQEINNLPIIKEKYSFYDNGKTAAKIIIRPMSDMRFTRETAESPMTETNSKTFVDSLFWVGILILLVAFINFVNFATAIAPQRMKTISISRVVGCSRLNSITTIIIETTLIFVSSYFIALLLAFIINKLFSASILGYEIPFEQNAFLLTLCGLMILLASIITGIYPALMNTSGKPVDSLKRNKVQTSLDFRGILSVCQFAATIALIVASVAVIKQVRFMKDANLGFNKENTLVIRLNNELRQNLAAFKQELHSNPYIKEFGCSRAVPGQSQEITTVNIDGKTCKFWYWATDADYMDVMKFEIVDGRGFLKASESDNGNMICNQTAANQFGWKVGMNIQGRQLVGIMKDFNMVSLREKVEPFAYWKSNDPGQFQFVSLKLQGDNVSAALSSIEKTYKEFNPSLPFRAFFLDDRLNVLYVKENQQARLITIFSVLSIMVSILGILGLSIFICQNKVKEIGIRKVNGAKVSEILALLNKDFIIWVTIAFIIAAPLSYYIMNQWLENFAYKTDISWWIFALAGFMALVIALLTVSFQSWKAATRNPVEALRYE
jgi:putative ABC transport system permease protein